MNKRIFKGLLVLGGMGVMLSCIKPKSFPPEPVIESVAFNFLSDSTGSMRINFTDGDGDIGLNEGDTISPFNPESKFNYNLYFYYFEFINGNWERVYLGIDPETGDTTNPFTYRIPVIETDGRDKSLEGEIEVDMPFGFFNPFSPYDSVRYEIELIDRALNSGFGVSEAIVKPN